MKTFVYKQVLCAKEDDKYYCLKLENNELVKEYFDTEEELKIYIDENYERFI